MRAVAFLLLLGLAAATRCSEGGQEGQEGPSDSNEMAPEDLARPRVVLVGQTGAGKSSLANSLLGVNPQEDSVIFPLGTGMESCTKKTRAGTGQWLGTGQNFTVVDTPGFSDGDGEMSELLDEMLDVLKNQVKSADVIVLLIKGSENRFNEGLQQMLSQMSAIFGEQWWEYMMIGVSFWNYRQSAIDDRDMNCPGRFCNDESWFQSEIEKQLNEKFKLSRRFPIAFAHSHSQTTRGREDPLQQKYWVTETQKIWDFANSKNTTFQFKDVDDILVENTRLKREVSRLNQFIDSNLTEIKAAMEVVKSDVHRNEVLQTAAVEKVQSNVDRIVADLTIAPLGTIIAWVTKPSARGVSTDLPPGWLRCDGGTIPRPSIWAGQLTPDINNQKRFLRGGKDQDQLTMEDDTTRMSDHKHIDHGHHHSATSSASDHIHKATSTATDHSHGYQDSAMHLRRESENFCGGNYWAFPHSDTYRRSDSAKVNVGTTVHKASISVSTTISSATTDHGGVSDLNSFNDETKPRNMNVIYIMRVW